MSMLPPAKHSQGGSASILHQDESKKTETWPYARGASLKELDLTLFRCNKTMSQVHAASAPGKVFLAGGYLVLDRKHTALTFALDARIHVVVRRGSKDGVVIVKSPQFINSSWTYRIENDHAQLRETSEHPNPFVRTALQHALSYVSALVKGMYPTPADGLDITILADNDYYSQPSVPGPKSEQVASSSRFRSFDKPITEVHKTGLGSSAALVTALIGAVFAHCIPKYESEVMMDPYDREILHRVAQIAHCAAQGKVGSGFDVATAVYGSCIYRRFSPSLMKDLESVQENELGEHLLKLTQAHETWDHKININRKVVIPPGLRLIMCDVDCGSQTPGMVKQVLKWRDENRQYSERLWAELQVKNDELADQLQLQSDTGGQGSLKGLQECFREIRKLIQEMSKAAGVPIEPAEQTRLLDACCEIQGVVGGVVPGAGGYDAITILIEDRNKVLEALEQLFKTWKFGAGGGSVRLLGVRGEQEGYRIEDVDRYTEWL